MPDQTAPPPARGSRDAGPVDASPVHAGYEPYVGPIRVLDAPADGAGLRLAFTIEPRHLNGADMLHGGMMMSFAAIALTRAAREAVAETAMPEAAAETAAPEAPARRVRAMSINCDFIGPGKAGEEAVATASVTRRTRTVVFCTCEIESTGRLLMSASGVFGVDGGDQEGPAQP